MNYNQILQYIVTWIKENHNNEITGDILQDVLVEMVKYVKEGSDNVDVDIQELQNQIDAISLAQEVNVFEGVEDPNVVPPTETFAAADIFVKTNTNDVFIFTGASWFNITQAGGGGGGASQEDELELTQDYPTIGTEIGDTQKDYNEKNNAIIAALVGNVPHPTYTAPTVSMTTPSALQKVGANYNVNLTLTYNQNDGGAITSQKIEKNGTQVSNTNTFSETLNVPIGLTTYKGTVNYAQGPIKNNSIGIPDPVGRIPAGSKSVTKNIEGVYPLFATTSSITVGTEQALVSMQSGNNVVLNLVGESGGNKQFFDIPQDWLDNRPLTKIEFFDFNTNAWNSQNQLSTFTAVANTHVVNGNTIDYKRYTNNGSNRGSIRMRLIF